MEVARTRLARYDELPNLQGRPRRQILHHQEPPELPAPPAPPPRPRTGGLDVIRKEAWPFYRTCSGVRLYWELEEPKGPKGEVARCYSTPQPSSQATVPVLAGEPRGRPTEAGQHHD